MATRSKAWVCGRSLAEIVGSNPTGGMHVCQLWVLCVVRGLCDGLITRPEEIYRLWCVWGWSRNLVNEEAIAYWGLLRQKTNKFISLEVCKHTLKFILVSSLYFRSAGTCTNKCHCTDHGHLKIRFTSLSKHSASPINYHLSYTIYWLVFQSI